LEERRAWYGAIEEAHPNEEADPNQVRPGMRQEREPNGSLLFVAKGRS
jgi:hypothetical protein